MKNNLSEDSISTFFQNPSLITETLQNGINAALLKHKQTGNPVCEWKEGKVVWIAPNEIHIKDTN